MRGAYSAPLEHSAPSPSQHRRLAHQLSPAHCVLGCTDGTSIWLTVEQTVELIHLERGHSVCQPPDVEADVAREAAQRLIPIDELADVLTQTRSDLEAAELLWVDVDTLRTRLAFLDDVERSRLGLTHDLAC